MFVRLQSAFVARSLASLAVPLVGLALAGCPDVENPDEGENEEEVITRVGLTFSPIAGGEVVTAAHSDPENDGSPVIDPITLDNGVAYTLTIRFENELADPVEDITAEVADEDDEHQVFISGSGVEGPATGDSAVNVVTHTYLDTDDNGLPVGLENRIVASAVGSGEFKVMLRHLPPEDGVATKVAGLAEAFATEGGGIAGEADVDVTFPITVE